MDDLPRIGGVLVPVFALRTPECPEIGDTAALTEFIDWAADCGFRVVKLLPVNETGGDNSPYNAISSVALDPVLLRLDGNWVPELIGNVAELDKEPGDGATVDYVRVKSNKLQRLEQAHGRFLSADSERKADFETFRHFNRAWLDAYSMFRALMDWNGSEDWTHWPEAHRTMAGAVAWANDLAPEEHTRFQGRRDFFCYVQWQAAAQWARVHEHARARGVKLMGDIPFGINFYSADVWSRPELFRLDWCGGTPPDEVFEHDAFVMRWGQNWGIPLYDWAAMRADGFAWWRQRVAATRLWFDLFRIDHVLGFYRIYGFPWRPEENADFLPMTADEARERSGGKEPRFWPRADDTDENKQANQADGETYLREILDEAGAGSVVGEDLGVVPDYVRPSLTQLGIAGYKVPQWEPDQETGGLADGKTYPRLSLTTYATHDHDPLRAMVTAWMAARESRPEAETELRNLMAFAGWDGVPESFTAELHESLLRALFASNASLAVVMITDAFAWEDRFNFPGVGEGNWTRRLRCTIEELRNLPENQMLQRLLKETGR